MELNIIFGIGLILIIVLVLKSRPKQTNKTTAAPQNFTCRKCRGIFPHTSRTLAAWNNNKRSFYCDKCHKEWRHANPQTQSHHQDFTKGNAGCMGFVVLFLFIPIGYFLF